MKKFPYESSFANLTIRPIVSEEKDRLLSIASLAEVSKFIPHVDTVSNTDLLPCAFNACVVNRVNKNTDVIDTSTALAMYKNFINKPINIEHNRQQVMGVILTAGFTAFGSDKMLTEEEVSKMTEPFNITLGGVVWRVVAPALASLIEDASDPTSEDYLSVSASWELGFTGYRIALLEGGKRNLSDATKIISDAKEVEAAQNNLISLGGKGKFEDLFAYRMPTYDVLPLGIGFTEKPAAEVKGIATEQQEKVGNENKPAIGKPAETNVEKPAKIPVNTPKNEVGIVEDPAFGKPTIAQEVVASTEKENKISQIPQTNVNLERTALTFMKFSSVKDITAKNLEAIASHEAAASAVSEFIETELTKSSKVWEAEKAKLDNQVAEATQKSTEALANLTKVQGEMDAVKKQLEVLAAEKLAREQVDTFNTRMTEVVAHFEFEEDVQKEIVEEVKALASDEAFAKWFAKAKVVLKGYAKKAAPFKKDDEKKDDAGKDGKKPEAKAEDDMDTEAKKKAKASEAKAAVEGALDNADASKGGLPNGGAAEKAKLSDLAKAAFAHENIIVRK